MKHREPSSTLAPALAVAMLVTGASVAAAQGGNALKGFQSTSDSFLEVDGKIDKDAQIYYQRQIPAYLVMPSASSPVLLVLRTQSVMGVQIMKISRAGDETLDLAPQAVYEQRGSFEIDPEGITFNSDGHRFAVKDKPPLLKVHQASDLLAYNDLYGERAEAYQFSQSAVDTLRKESRAVSIRVYFGSWCHFCQQYVPKILRVQRELQGSNITIDYYGLPHDFGDPIVKRLGISGVPTAVLYIDGKEIGRLVNEDWRAPEESLVKKLGG